MSELNLTGFNSSGSRLLTNVTCSENGKGALRIPQGVSGERPVTAHAGMIRYNTTDNLIEYYNGDISSWLPISQPPPTLNTVSPAFFNIGTDNSFNLNYANEGNLIHITPEEPLVPNICPPPAPPLPV